MAYITIAIGARDSAPEGIVVSAYIGVKNITAFHYSFKGEVSAVPELYPDYVIGSIDQIIKRGESATLKVSFLMPDCNVTIFVWVERWAFDHWEYAGSASKVVSLEAVIPPPTVWVHLDSREISIIAQTIIPNWIQLDSKEISVIVLPEIADWIQLDSKEISIIPSFITSVWTFLDEATVDIKSVSKLGSLVPWVVGIGAVGLAAYAVTRKTGKNK